MRTPSLYTGRLGLTLLLLGGCGPAPRPSPLSEAYSAEQCPSCAEWNQSTSPFQIFGNTYYVGTKGLASVLITSPDGHILLDGGLPNSAPLIEESIRALGFDIADVKLILNSHAHFDHAGGLAALQQASGARVAALSPSAAAIRQGNSSAEDPQFGELLGFPPVTNVVELVEGDTVRVASLAVVAHSTPVHTSGGTTWTWQSCEADRCVNLVFADSQTPISADGFRFSQRADTASFEPSFVLLEELPCDILITPHPGASSLWERHASAGGLVDPSGCRRYAATARERLAQRLATEPE
ncbi:MAG: subclass B3 metallo-beta-lactamase [Gemmatimonadales bacterium]